MNKQGRKTIKNIFVLVVSLLVLALIFSCNFSLEPAWKNQTNISIKLGGAFINTAPQNKQSRALLTNKGSLYIITNQTTNENTIYGPYTASSNTATIIKDIPAGNYKNIILLFSPNPIDLDKNINNDDTDIVTIGEKLNDAPFISSLASNPIRHQDDDASAFIDALSNSASIAIKKDYTIKEGRTNTLSATLIPLANSIDNEGPSGDNYTLSSENKIQRFILFENLQNEEEMNLEFSFVGNVSNAKAYCKNGLSLKQSVYKNGSLTIEENVNTVFLAVVFSSKLTINYKLVPNYTVYQNALYVGEFAKGEEDGSSPDNAIALSSLADWAKDPEDDTQGEIDTLVVVENIVLSDELVCGKDWESKDIYSSFPILRNLNIISLNDKKFTIKLSRKNERQTLFTVGKSGSQSEITVTFENLILEGETISSHPYHLISVFNKSTLKIINSIIQNNDANNYNGGGINTDGHVILNSSTVTNCKGQEGGGIRVGNSGKLTLKGNYSITKNKANTNGGGISVFTGGEIVDYETNISDMKVKIKDNEANVNNEDGQGSNLYYEKAVGSDPESW